MPDQEGNHILRGINLWHIVVGVLSMFHYMYSMSEKTKKKISVK